MSSRARVTLDPSLPVTTLLVLPSWPARETANRDSRARLEKGGFAGTNGLAPKLKFVTQSDSAKPISRTIHLASRLRRILFRARARVRARTRGRAPSVPLEPEESCRELPIINAVITEFAVAFQSFDHTVIYRSRAPRARFFYVARAEKPSRFASRRL